MWNYKQLPRQRIILGKGAGGEFPWVLVLFLVVVSNFEDKEQNKTLIRCRFSKQLSTQELSSRHLTRQLDFQRDSVLV